MRRWEERPCLATTQRLYRQGLCVGADGSLVQDSGQAYHVGLFEVIQIDYFHGCVDYYRGQREPVCQTADEAENDYLGMELIATTSKSWVVRRIISLQRMWREQTMWF